MHRHSKTRLRKGIDSTPYPAEEEDTRKQADSRSSGDGTQEAEYFLLGDAPVQEELPFRSVE